MIFPTGKSTLLSALGRRELEIPRHVDIFHLTREMEASDKTALESVKEVDQEKMRLEKEAEELAHVEGPGKSNGGVCIGVNIEEWINPMLGRGGEVGVWKVSIRISPCGAAR